MTTFQEYLNQLYPTEEEKEKVKDINYSRSLLTIKKQIKELEGGELDVSKYPNLETIEIYGNYLKSPLIKLELGEKPRLTELTCSRNQLTSLNLADCSNLERVYCLNNQISNLNIQNCAKLKELDYSDNPLFEDLNLNRDFVNSLDFANYPDLKRDLLLNWSDIHEDFGKRKHPWSKTYQQEWEKAGLTYQDAQILILVGFKPEDYEEVKKWKEAGFDSPTTQEWIQAGFKINEAEKAKQWKDQSFAPEQTKQLIEIGFLLFDWRFAKQWKDLGFSLDKIKSWIEKGLNSHELNFANHLKKTKNIQPSQLSTSKLFQLRKEFYPSYPQAQDYLNKNYPCDCNEYKKDEYSNKSRLIHQENCLRGNAKGINLRNLNLEGNLDLEGFRNLEKIYLAGNPNLREIKDNCRTLVYQNPTEWFNHQYPDKKVDRIDFDNVNNNLGFEQSSELILDDYPNLKKISGKNISILTKLNITNCPKLGLIEIINFWNLQSLVIQEDCFHLKSLSCSNNNLNQDLSFLKDLVNLERLELKNNKSHGSLKPLKSMNKLKTLDIGDTDIDSGLEYLPNSLEEFYCSANERKDAKVKAIYDLFADEKGEVEMENGWVKNFPQKLKEYKQKKYWEEVENNSTEKIEELIEKKQIDVNLKDEYESTTLHYSVVEENLDLTKFLLEKGADPNEKDELGNTPLHFAAKKNNLELLKLLFEKGEEKGKKVDIDATNDYGWSILHSAASGIVNNNGENWEILTWLLGKGADKEAKAKNGFSVRDVFSQKDWSCAEKYDRLIRNFYIIQKAVQLVSEEGKV